MAPKKTSTVAEKAPVVKKEKKAPAAKKERKPAAKRTFVIAEFNGEEQNTGSYTGAAPLAAAKKAARQLMKKNDSTSVTFAIRETGTKVKRFYEAKRVELATPKEVTRKNAKTGAVVTIKITHEVITKSLRVEKAEKVKVVKTKESVEKKPVEKKAVAKKAVVKKEPVAKKPAPKKAAAKKDLAVVAEP